MATAPDTDTEFVLEDGRVVVISHEAQRLAGPTAAEGELLIYGEEPLPDGEGGPWIVGVRGYPNGCYLITANGEIRGDRMALSLGFSLPLADDFDTEGRSGRTFVDAPTNSFCLDADGQVTALRFR
ncbi:MAG: hypothetical protein ACRDGB_08380 [Candidatus Limnocylindria bacterium]